MPLPLLGIAATIAAEFAPDLIKHLAGPRAASVAETVTQAAVALTGQDTPLDALEAIQADPALAVQLRSELARIEADLTKAALADRRDARKRDVELQKTKGGNHRADFMLAGVFAVFVGILAAIYFGTGLSDLTVNLLSAALGLTGGMLKDAFGFEFGSSRGSKDKDFTINANGG